MITYYVHEAPTVRTERYVSDGKLLCNYHPGTASEQDAKPKLHLTLLNIFIPRGDLVST